MISIMTVISTMNMIMMMITLQTSPLEQKLSGSAARESQSHLGKYWIIIAIVIVLTTILIISKTVIIIGMITKVAPGGKTFAVDTTIVS